MRWRIEAMDSIENIPKKDKRGKEVKGKGEMEPPTRRFGCMKKLSAFSVYVIWWIYLYSTLRAFSDKIVYVYSGIVCILIGFACFQIVERLLIIYGRTHAIYICSNLLLLYKCRATASTCSHWIALDWKFGAMPDEWGASTREKWVNDTGSWPETDGYTLQ